MGWGLSEPLFFWHLLDEVKIRGPNQGLGPITMSKKGGPKNHVVGPIPQIISVVIPEQHFL